MTVVEIWEEFRRETGIDSPYSSWAFCGGGKEADELLELVKEGRKRGTASLLLSYEMEKEPVPKEGDYSVVTDSKGEGCVIIRDTKVSISPFMSIHPYHAYLEGEGARSLSSWREVHARFFAPDYKALSLPFDPRGLVLAEEFEVVWPKEYMDKDPVYLTLPDIKDKDEYYSYREEFRESHSSMDGCGSLSRIEDIESWIEKENGMWNGENLEKGFVPSTTLVAKRRIDGQIVGMVNILHKLNEHLMNYGGNIGYSVRPSERRKGYGSLILKLSLSYCRALNMEKALVTCNEENQGSRKIIEKNGGKYENTVKNGDILTQRYWIKLNE